MPSGLPAKLSFRSSFGSLVRNGFPFPAVVKAKPHLKEVEAFKTVLSGDREAIAKLSLKELEEIAVATLTGMTVDEFQAEATEWIETAKHPRWNRLYTDLTYQPMLEVMGYLRDNGYKTYIVTGAARRAHRHLRPGRNDLG